MIGQAAVIGDARSYNTALIVLDGEYVQQWAGQQGIEEDSIDALAVNDEVRAAVQAEVDAANKRLARVEQIKKFEILHCRVGAGRRRADADHEAPAQADRRRSTRTRSKGCTPSSARRSRSPPARADAPGKVS